MKMSAKYLYSAAVLTALLQTGILFAGIEKRAQILRNGQDIVVRTSRVDPRDLMRGDYVILGYEFSLVAQRDVKGAGDHYDGDIYVAVKKGTDGFWHKSRASASAFTDLSADEVQIKGKATSPINGQAAGKVRLRFGIERYYVPEDEGLALEGEVSEDNIAAIIAVSQSGIAQIKALQNKGEKIYQEPLY